MARTRLALWALSALALAMLSMSGCFKVEGTMKVGVDGSSDVKLAVAVSEALAAMGTGEEGADPLAEMKEDLPEGWEAESITEEGWTGVAMSARIAPGQPIFPEEMEGSGTGVTVRVVQRQFCTDYYIEGTLTPPEGAEDLTETADGEAGVVFTQDTEQGDEGEDEEGDEGQDEEGGLTDEDIGGLMGAFGQQPSLSFTVSAPGTIVFTSGEEVDDGTAVWAIDMSKLSDEATESVALDVRMQTRLLNYQSIGRLADKLAAERDLPDMAALIADYVARDLLPNPPKDAPLKAGIDTEAFESAISTIIAFEEVLGDDTAARVIAGLKLNADGVSAKDLNETWALVQQMESEELVEVAAQAIVKHVRMRGK